MKKIIITLAIFINIFATEVDVDIQADTFVANQQKNIVTFTGHVSMIKGEDTLVCEKLIVHTKIDEISTYCLCPFIDCL